MKIVADQDIPYIKDYFEDCGELVLKPGRLITNSDLKTADLLIIRSVTRVDQTLLANTKVQCVGSIATGVDHLDLNWLKEAGIFCAVASGFNVPGVADYIMSVIACLQQQQCLETSFKLGIIGVGRVGRLVQTYAHNLNIHTITSDPYRALYDPEFNHVSLEEITSTDLISLHVPLTKSGSWPTYHFINETFLRQLKPNAILINTSRGAVIDTNVLLKRIENIKYVFDVWEHEPNIHIDLLRNALIATPHIAGYALQSKTRGIQMIRQQLEELGFINKKTCLNDQPKVCFDFEGNKKTWQEVILRIFDPLQETKLMKETLLNAPNVGYQFDYLRKNWNRKSEFQYVTIKNVKLIDTHRSILKKLGLTLID